MQLLRVGCREPEHADELFALRLAIDDEVDGLEWSAFATVFSSLITSRCGGAARAMDLSRCLWTLVRAVGPREALVSFTHMRRPVIGAIVHRPGCL
jgi:hypothetical protein